MMTEAGAFCSVLATAMILVGAGIGWGDKGIAVALIAIGVTIWLLAIFRR